ncbi:MAG: hypothetical protein ACYS8W_19625 [Planctomycetota bacterium]|jgi:hypothetical protein
MRAKLRELALDVGFSLLLFLMLTIVSILASGRMQDFTYVAF